jgi:glycosyltransferase involved in cell wall biosynthesis
MKILYVIHQFFPKHYTGTERFTFELASQMQRMGHSPTVITYEPGNGVKNFEKFTERILITRYSYRGIPVIALKHTKPADSSDIFDSAVEEAAEKLALKCDLVHVCHPMWLSSLAATYKKYSIPMVMTLTDAWLLCPSALLDRHFRLCNGPSANGGCTSCNVGAKMKSRLEEAKELYDMADEITTASRFIQTLYQKNGWNRRIGIVPHSINFESIKRIDNPKREVTFAFIGTIGWHKGAHVLIEAARQISNRNLKVKIYGSTLEQLDYSRALLNLAQGDDRIQFLGSFEIEELPKIMSDISALVIPSTYPENYPLVMLIALAYKVPPIVSNIGGMPEVVKNGFNGFLFKMGNHAELASILQRIVEKPQILDELRANMVTPRRTEEEALDYENIYRKLAVDNSSG